MVLREIQAPNRHFRFAVGLPEGVAIAYAWKRLPTPRPLTHELFAGLLEQFHVSLEVVEITASSEPSTYLAHLTLVSGTERRVLSSRPSDALALALRQRLPVPVMVEDALLSA
ncbi:MAG: bifunctional nuclease family protein [Candidatus Dormibacteria bacterium]